MGVFLSGEIANRLLIFEPQKANRKPQQIFTVCWGISVRKIKPNPKYQLLVKDFLHIVHPSICPQGSNPFFLYIDKGPW